MEVIFISSIDPYVPKPGGTRSYVMGSIRCLCEQGVTTTLIGLSYNKKRTIYKYPFTFVPVVRTQKTSSYKFLFNLFLKVPFLKIAETSIIHAQRPDDLLPFMLFNRKNPKVCTLHGLSSKKIHIKKGSIIGKIYDSIERFALKRVDGIIAVDDSTKRHYITKYPWLENGIKVIPVGIDLEQFKPLDKQKMREKYGFKGTDKLIMYIGRLEKEKNLSFLIKMFKRMNIQQSNYKLVFVGDGKERENLKNLSSHLELFNNVIFMGAIDPLQIPEIINCADVVVLCSLFESGPLVIQEAIACGIPVVTTDVGRVREFTKNDKIGKIVNSSEEEFAEAIKRVLGGTQNHILGRRAIAQEFSFEKTAKSLIQVYEELGQKIGK